MSLDKCPIVQDEIKGLSNMSMTDEQRNNALATVMEADGWADLRGGWYGGEWATENDKIAACVRWLDGQSDRFYSGRAVGLAVFASRFDVDEPLLDRLLAAVAECMEDG